MKKITSEKRKTAPIIAFLFSLLLVGLGQILNGQVRKGILMFLVSLLFNLIMMETSFVYMEIIRIIVCLYSGYDAYKLAKTLKKGKEVSEFKFFY